MVLGATKPSGTQTGPGEHLREHFGDFAGEKNAAPFSSNVSGVMTLGIGRRYRTRTGDPHRVKVMLYQLS